MGVQIPDALLQPSKEGRAHLVMTNPSGYTQVVEPGATLGEAAAAGVVEHLPPGMGVSAEVVSPRESCPVGPAVPWM